MNLTRRETLRGGSAAVAAIAVTGAVVAAAVPAVVTVQSQAQLPVAAAEPSLDPEALEVARLFMLIGDDATRASLHCCASWCAGQEPDPAVRSRIPPASAYYTRDIAILDRGEAAS